MGFTLAQTFSLLVLDTSVSRSLDATFSELIGQPTPPYLHVPGPSTVAPITGTTETLPSSVASSLEPLPTVILPASQAAPVPDPTQAASASLPVIEGHIAQSSGSDNDAAQFQIAHRASAPDSFASAPPTDP